MTEVIRINGRRWRLMYAPGLREQYGVYGDCDAASKPRKAIRLDPDQTDEELLDTLLHELSHVIWADLSEAAVERIAREYGTAVLAMFEVKRRCVDGNDERERDAEALHGLQGNEAG